MIPSMNDINIKIKTKFDIKEDNNIIIILITHDSYIYIKNLTTFNKMYSLLIKLQ